MKPAATIILGLAYFMLAGQIIGAYHLDLKPSISVLPDYNAVRDENLTILCQGPQEVLTFTLVKDGNVNQVQPASGQQAEFHIIGAEDRDAGEYTCHYNLKSNSSGWSESSDILDISVKERYSEPSIIALPRRVIRKGTDLVITCSGQRPSMRFLLYRNNMIFQQEDPVGKEARFSIMQATEDDVGQYICYYCSTSGVTEICSELSNPVLINITELLKPEISLENDPDTEGGYFILCSAPEEHTGSWFRLFRENILIREEKAEADAKQVAFAVEHSAGEYKCLYRVRVSEALADSPFSESMSMDKDFTSGNTFRFLLAGLVLILIVMIVIGCLCWKKKGNGALTRQPASMTMKEDFQKDPSVRVSLQTTATVEDCVEDTV